MVDLCQGEEIPAEILAALSDESVTKVGDSMPCSRGVLVKLSWGMAGAGVLEMLHGLVCHAWPSAVFGKCGRSAWAGKAEAVGRERPDPVFLRPLQADQDERRRTRNLPEHDREKWGRFKAYNLRDVEAEMQIQQRLSKFPVPEFVWEEYWQDQEINDRGIGVDMEMVAQAIAMDGRSKSELSAAMQELTELENPNSVQQMKQWLSENGMETDSLDKKRWRNC